MHTFIGPLRIIIAPKVDGSGWDLTATAGKQKFGPVPVSDETAAKIGTAFAAINEEEAGKERAR